MGLFEKKELSSDFVELSIGRIDYKVLRWGIINDCLKKSTIIKDILNNAIFIDNIENAVVDLSKEKRDKLTVEDGLKLRAKTNEILRRYGLLKETKTESRIVESDGFSEEDTKELDRQYERMQSKIRAMQNEPMRRRT